MQPRSNNFSVLILGEGHNDPTAKNFITDNIESLMQAGFNCVLLEGVVPETIPTLMPHPTDKTQTLESYQNLYTACKKRGVSLEYVESLEGRILMNHGVDPALPEMMELRERKFINDILAINKKCVFITGAAHAANIATRLQAINIPSMIVIAGPKTNPIEKFSAGIPSHLLLLKQCTLRITDPLAGILSAKLLDATRAVSAAMKKDPSTTHREERIQLHKLHTAMSHLFKSIQDQSFQLDLSTFEYLIGSLYAREGNYELAHQFTRIALKRRSDNHATPESIAKYERKLEELADKINTSKQNNSPRPK